MDTQRLILFFIFSFSLLLLWDAWQKDQRPKPAPVAEASTVPGKAARVPDAIPAPARATQAAPAPAAGKSVV